MTTGRINQVSHSFPFVQLSFSETLVEFLLSPARFSGGLHHSTLVPVACWKNSSFSSSQHPLCMRHPRSLIRHTHIMHAASSFPYSPYTHYACGILVPLFARHIFLVYFIITHPTLFSVRERQNLWKLQRAICVCIRCCMYVLCYAT